MHIQSESHGTLFVVRPEGDISNAAATELDELLEAAIDDGARLMVFDCTGLSHISSDGLRVLLKTLRRLRDTDGRAVLLSEHVFPAHRTEFVVELPQAERSIAPTGLRLVE